MTIPKSLLSDFLSVCTRLYEKGFVAATDGNVSARLSTDRILCTPTALNKGDVTEQDLIIVDMRGRIIEGNRRASTELQMHLLFYERRPEVNAVVHAHPIHATGFATAGMDLMRCIFPEIIVSLGAVPLAPYATPSTHEVPESILSFVETHDAILLRNHGVVTAGTDLRNAYYTLERLERAANILLVARILGGETMLTHDQVKDLLAVIERNYGINPDDKPSCVIPEISPVARKSYPGGILEIKSAVSKAILDLGFNID